jgi:hypothetical protein
MIPIPLDTLLQLIRAASGTGYSGWLKEIAAKQGILTHELPAISKRSNNPADISRATVWRWNKESNLPKPVKFNGSTRWKLSDLEAWEQQKSGSAM